MQIQLHRINNDYLGRLRELVMDRETWRAAIHGVAKSRTRLSNWTELNWTDLTYTVSISMYLIESKGFLMT